MIQKTEEKLFEDWNDFGSIIHLINEDTLKMMVDKGIKPTFAIHKNFSDIYRKLGDNGTIKLEYTPRTINPTICLGDKIVYATIDGVWVGENKNPAEVLQDKIIRDCSAPISSEECLIVSELVKTGKKEDIIWEYLTNNKIDTKRLSSPPKGDELGLTKTDWIGAAYFLCDGNDPRKRKVKVQAKIPLLNKKISFDYTVGPTFKNFEDFFIVMSSEAKDSIRIVEGELNEIFDSPLQTLALKNAANRGVDVQIITGPNIYFKEKDFSKIYEEPIELKDNLKLSFSKGGLASMGRGSPSEETIKTAKEKALIFSYTARMNEKPILFSLASQACEDAMKKEGGSYDLLSLLAFNQYKNADFSGAVRTAEKAREASKGTSYEAEAHSNLGFIYPKVGRYGDAIKVLEKGIELNEEQIYIHNNLATAYHLLAASAGKPEHFKKADKHYRKELENTPDHQTAEKMLNQVNILERLTLT